MARRSVSFTKQAARALLRMPKNDAARVRAKIDQYVDDPAGLANNVTKLVGSNFSRLRVGGYRVIFLDDLTIVEVVTIGTRGGVYD